MILVYKNHVIMTINDRLHCLGQSWVVCCVSVLKTLKRITWSGCVFILESFSMVVLLKSAFELN